MPALTSLPADGLIIRKSGTYTLCDDLFWCGGECESTTTTSEFTWSRSHRKNKNKPSSTYNPIAIAIIANNVTLNLNGLTVYSKCGNIIGVCIAVIGARNVTIVGNNGGINGFRSSAIYAVNSVNVTVCGIAITNCGGLQTPDLGYGTSTSPLVGFYGCAQSSSSRIRVFNSANFTSANGLVDVGNNVAAQECPIEEFLAFVVAGLENYGLDMAVMAVIRILESEIIQYFCPTTLDPMSVGVMSNTGSPSLLKKLDVIARPGTPGIGAALLDNSTLIGSAIGGATGTGNNLEAISAKLIAKGWRSSGKPGKRVGAIQEEMMVPLAVGLMFMPGSSDEWDGAPAIAMDGQIADTKVRPPAAAAAKAESPWLAGVFQPGQMVGVTAGASHGTNTGTIQLNFNISDIGDPDIGNQGNFVVGINLNLSDGVQIVDVHISAVGGATPDSSDTQNNNGVLALGAEETNILKCDLLNAIGSTGEDAMMGSSGITLMDTANTQTYDSVAAHNNFGTFTTAGITNATLLDKHYAKHCNICGIKDESGSMTAHKRIRKLADKYGLRCTVQQGGPSDATILDTDSSSNNGGGSSDSMESNFQVLNPAYTVSQSNLDTGTSGTNTAPWNSSLIRAAAAATN